MTRGGHTEGPEWWGARAGEEEAVQGRKDCVDRLGLPPPLFLFNLHAATSGGEDTARARRDHPERQNTPLIFLYLLCGSRSPVQRSLL